MQIRRDLAAENLTHYLIILYTQGNQKLQCDISNFPKILPGRHLFYHIYTYETLRGKRAFLKYGAWLVKACFFCYVFGLFTAFIG